MISDERKSALLQHSEIAQFMRWLCEPDTTTLYPPRRIGLLVLFFCRIKYCSERDEKMGHLLCVVQNSVVVVVQADVANIFSPPLLRICTRDACNFNLIAGWHGELCTH